MKTYRHCLLLAAGLLAGGCDMIDYHPYDTRTEGELHVNSHHIALIEAACLEKDTLRIAVTGDSQRWYDETKDFVADVNQRAEVDFVIHGGDLSDFGVTDEFLWQRDILDDLRVPYVCLIGNHDCLGTGEDTFRAVFGNPNFSFIAGRTKFVCLNTNAMEYDYSRPIPDFGFIEEEATARATEFDRTIVCMHVRPYADQFNNNVARVFHYAIGQLPGLLFCTAAHEHKAMELDLFDDGIIYYVTDCMKHRSYSLFTLTPDGCTHETISF